MDKTPEQIVADIIDQHKRELASCERMIELLTPEWERFEARTGHDTYVARDYADHFSAARTHRKKIAALETVLARAIIQQETTNAD